jgi:hypothetical protein
MNKLVKVDELRNSAQAAQSKYLRASGRSKGIPPGRREQVFRKNTYAKEG